MTLLRAQRQAVIDAHETRRAAIRDAHARGLAADTSAASLGNVIDVAWYNPTVAQLRALGVAGVLGYFSPDTSKNLSADQIASYTAAGYGIGTVWESTAGRALAGQAAGATDAHAAEAQRAAAGLPATYFHRAAVDTDTSWASVAPYFAGWSSVVGRARVAPYGGIKVTEGAYAAGYRRCWQTLAWSAGKLDPHAVLYQNGTTALGGNADMNDILAADWGQYLPEDDVTAPTAAQNATAVWKTDFIPAPPGAKDIKTNPTWQPQSYLTGTYEHVLAVEASLATLTAKVAALESVALTDAQVAAIAAAVGPAIADVLAKRLAS